MVAAWRRSASSGPLRGLQRHVRRRARSCVQSNLPAMPTIGEGGLIPPISGQSLDQLGNLTRELRPHRGQSVKLGEAFADLPDRAPGACGAFAQALHLLAFGLRLGRDAYEFFIAIGEGGEVEAIGLDDALGLWIAAAVTLAGL